MVCLIIKKETAFCTSLVWVLIDHHIMWTYTQASFRFKDLLSCVTKFSTVFLLYKYRSVDGEGPYRSPRPAVRVSCVCVLGQKYINIYSWLKRNQAWWRGILSSTKRGNSSSTEIDARRPLSRATTERLRFFCLSFYRSNSLSKTFERLRIPNLVNLCA